jgi:tetratricopeptide (TPR) repeat protein
MRPKWDQLNRRVINLMQKGRLEEALEPARRAVALAEEDNGGDRLHLAVSLNNLGELHHGLGQFEAAEAALKRSIAISTSELGKNHPEVGDSLANLAELFVTQARYEEAIPLLERVLVLREKEKNAVAAVTAALNSLASAHEAMGDTAAARPLLERCNGMLEAALGDGHPDLGPVMTRLGLIAWQERRLADAESYFRRTLSLYEQTIGPAHPAFATTLSHLSDVYLANGLIAAAEPFMQQALEIRRETLPEHHPDIAASLNQLALLYQAKGQPNRSGSHAQRRPGGLRPRLTATATRPPPRFAIVWESII